MIFDDGEIFIGGILAGFIIAIVVVGMNGTWSEVRELGQAICEERLEMDYYNYDDKKLKCKLKEIKAEIVYDGIIIEINN